MRVLMRDIARAKRVVARAITWARRGRAQSTDDAIWLRLPGQVLELGTTGFQIRLEPRRMGDQTHMCFVGYSPEMKSIAWSADNLPELKTYVERLASYRRELQL